MKKPANRHHSPYYFHAGESNRNNNSDIVEAIMLRSKRIGHGLALIKHPALMDKVRSDTSLLKFVRLVIRFSAMWLI
ncbi:MAG: hypothetical protein IPL69_19670 [Saprospiraceae bacterium]|nr:hypothetical protein [Candidatus Brachybacter algidus]